MHFERHQSSVVLASVLTVLAFLGNTFYTQYRLAAIDEVSAAIATNAIPSLQYLGRSRVGLEELRQLVTRAVETPSAPQDTVPPARAELQALHDDLDRYLRLTPLHGEDELWRATRLDFDRVEDATGKVLHAVEGADSSAVVLLRTEFAPALDRARDTVRRAMEFDVEESERLAREVRELRRASTNTLIILDATATAIAALLALMAVRAARERDRLWHAHNALLSARVAELDRFAGRVAHDILSPLNTVGMSLALMAPSASANTHPLIDRSERALQRVKQLVEGLLQFARSGAQVDGEAQAAIDVVVRDVALDYSELADAAGLELVVEVRDRVSVACSAAVLTSIVQNLVSNAIKYIGNGPTRKVMVRGKAEGSWVRLEIADTGPGSLRRCGRTCSRPLSAARIRTSTV